MNLVNLTGRVFLGALCVIALLYSLCGIGTSHSSFFLKVCEQEKMAVMNVGATTCVWIGYCPTTSSPCPACTPATQCSKANHFDWALAPGEIPAEGMGEDGNYYDSFEGDNGKVWGRRWNCPHPSGGGCSRSATASRSICRVWRGCSGCTNRAYCGSSVRPSCTLQLTNGAITCHPSPTCVAGGSVNCDGC